MKDCQIKINNKKDINDFINTLSKKLSAPCCICLIGPLGVGKTYFSKRLIKKLCGPKINVNSPTFSLVNVYEKLATNLQIWHVDLYRINNEEEIIELGLEEALQKHIVIIEWANRLNKLYPQNAITIELAFTENNKRTLTLKS